MKNLFLFIFLTLVSFDTTARASAVFDSEEPPAKIVIEAKEIFLEEFPTAFNPSIVKYGDGYLLSFRYCPNPVNESWVSYIGVVLLNDSFEPVSKPQLLNTRTMISKTPSQSEDARIFEYRGRVFLIYNDNNETLQWYYFDRRDMYLMELFYDHDEFRSSTPMKLVHEKNYHSQYQQKNWVPFTWNNTLLLTYSINPHEVIYTNLYNGLCYTCYKTQAEINWEFGPMRGSTPPVLVDGEYLAFFHSGMPMSSPYSYGWELWHYFAGAYTFSSKPPFEITKVSALPIVGQHFYTRSNCPKRVIFPGGIFVSGSLIYMVYGKDDCEIWVATLDKEVLKASLVPVRQMEEQ